MKLSVKCLMGATAAAALSFGITAGAQAASHSETFKIGIVTFLSGGAAESFGVPALNGGKLLIEMMNKGELPALMIRKASAA
ncbi:MAG: hypothetical protein P1U65_08510 [Minwuia sp.]|nr:hypothetical protein [Minwuia sp.]